MAVEVGDIMTDSLTTFDVSKRVKPVREKMKDESFDVAPLEAGGSIRYYTTLKDLENSEATNKVHNEKREINETILVGPALPVVAEKSKGRDLLSVLEEYDNRFVFVVEDGITGIITHADLNKPEAKIPFFRLMSEYERKLTDLIEQEISGLEWLGIFEDKGEDEDDASKIKSIYKDEKEENAELRYVDCLNTNQIHKVIRHYDLTGKLNLNGENAEETLCQIEKIRNKIMHQRPLIGDGSFEDLVEAADKLREANEALENH